MSLSADIYCDATGRKWTAEIREHPVKGGAGVLVWSKTTNTEHNATEAMEAEWQRREPHR